MILLQITIYSIEKNYIRRLNNPKQSRQKIYFLTAKKGMRLLNECIDSCCEDLLSSSNLGLARIALALEKSSLATLTCFKCLSWLLGVDGRKA